MRPRGRLWQVLAAGGLVCWLVGGTLRADAADELEPVSLRGAGDSDNLAELTGWQDDLFAATQPVDLAYFQVGTKDGRQQLLDGLQDFTIGGVPFTAEELAARPSGAGEIIAAPVSVGAVSLLFSTPPRVGWSTERIRTEDPTCQDLDDPDFDPEACSERGEYTGPIRIPPNNLAALILGLTPTYLDNQLASWSSPGIRTALGTGDLSIMGRVGQKHSFVERTEGSATSKYLMVYAKALGPEAWELRKQENPQFPWEPVGEVFSSRTLSQNGAESQIGIMTFPFDAATRTDSELWVGNAGPVPTTYVSRFQGDFPASGFRIAEVQNAHGDWVAPSPESIRLAVEAGTEPAFAATHDVPGAYPLVWVNRLYTVAGTLTPDEANALAAAVRYLVTDGQASVVAHGGAALTAALRDEALAAADEIVAANCHLDGHRVVVGGPGPMEADLPGVQALTGLAHCEAEPEAATTTTTTEVDETTTTTTTTATTVPVVGSRPVVPNVPYVPYVPPAVDPPEIPDDTVADESPPATTVEEQTDASPTTSPSSNVNGRPRRGRALAALPLPNPDDGSGGFQKLGSLMLGASAFLFVRRLVDARRAPA